jgi:hypothetical protein
LICCSCNILLFHKLSLVWILSNNSCQEKAHNIIKHKLLLKELGFYQNNHNVYSSLKLLFNPKFLNLT